MRILIPIIGFDRTGGYRVLSQLATAWSALGAEVDFLVDQRTAAPYFPTRAGIRYFNRRGDEVAAEHRQGAFRARGDGVSIHLGLWRALRRLTGEYDVVLANHSMTALPVALSPLPRSGPQGRFYYVQAYEPEYFATLSGARARVLQALAWLSYRLPLAQVANAPLFVGYRGVRATDWVQPGVDLSVFTRRTAPLPVGPTAPWTLGTIGRMEPAKGTPQVLAAFERLATSYPQLRLKVAYGGLPAGWSHPRAELVVPRDDVELAAYYRSLDVLLALPQMHMGAFHFPVMEAMASGAAVVTTGFLPANERNAWIVPPGDTAAVVAAVGSIIDGPPANLAARLDVAAGDVQACAVPAVATRFLRLIETHLLAGRA